MLEDYSNNSMHVCVCVCTCFILKGYRIHNDWLNVEQSKDCLHNLDQKRETAIRLLVILLQVATVQPGSQKHTAATVAKKTEVNMMSGVHCMPLDHQQLRLKAIQSTSAYRTVMGLVLNE